MKHAVSQDDAGVWQVTTEAPNVRPLTAAATPADVAQGTQVVALFAVWSPNDRSEVDAAIDACAQAGIELALVPFEDPASLEAWAPLPAHVPTPHWLGLKDGERVFNEAGAQNPARWEALLAKLA